MSQDTSAKIVGYYRQIEVAAGSAGWIVSKDGRPVGSFDDLESAYKKALAICDRLFDEGARASVRQVHPLNA